MNILVLGGTRFVGRHIVERLVGSGHRVVCFHRGGTPCELPAEVEERRGDRDVDLSSVSSEAWDAIVDTCCYRPEQILRSLGLRADRYLLISTINVYRDLSVRGVSEEAPTIEAFDPSDEAARYGGNKAACERLLVERYPKQSIIFRPGLIAGKWDYTGRFTYWCRRFLRGGRVLAPEPASRFIQFIDAADIARFAERALASNIVGIFNVVGPAAPATMRRLLDECALVASEFGARPATIAWAARDCLLEHGAQEWSELPLWLVDPRYAGLLEMSNEKAIDAGFRSSAIAETIRSVLDWANANDPPNQTGMSAEREAELLEKCCPHHSEVG